MALKLLPMIAHRSDRCSTEDSAWFSVIPLWLQHETENRKVGDWPTNVYV